MIFYAFCMGLLALWSNFFIVKTADAFVNNIGIVNGTVEFDKKYCGKLDCPDYVVVEKTEDYELRHYKL